MSNNHDAYRDLLRLIHRVALLADRVGERQFGEAAGVGRAMFLVLRTIGNDGVTAQQDIADRLSLTKGAVSKRVASAVDNGWLTVTASPVSRREHALALTDAGRAVVERGLAVQAERERLADTVLDAGDIEAAIRVLTGLLQQLELQDKS